jgi:NAD dependent epimerase/dehydratase
MMKCLITGAAGFIGSHLVELCVKNNFQVKAFVHYNSKNSWGWLENLGCLEDIEIISGDIRDYDSVYSAMKGCRTVFHLAALIGIPYSYISPLAYIRTNVEGTYNVLQSAREMDLENVIITSTSETYGTAQHVPMDEKHPLVGQSPYSATKIAADQLALSYQKSFNLPVKIIRPFNTYGPRQSARAVIPTIITQLLTGTKLNLGNLHPTRDFTYVKDTASAFVEICKSDAVIGQVTNVGMNSEISIGELAALIGRLTGNEIVLNADPQRIRPDNSEVERLYCDNKKILSLTSWKPEYNIESGLLETIDWIKDNLSIYKHALYNV